MVERRKVAQWFPMGDIPVSILGRFRSFPDVFS